MSKSRNSAEWRPCPNCGTSISVGDPPFSWPTEQADPRREHALVHCLALVRDQRDAARADLAKANADCNAHAAETREWAEKAKSEADANTVERGEWSKAMRLLIDNGTYAVEDIVPSVQRCVSRAAKAEERQREAEDAHFAIGQQMLNETTDDESIRFILRQMIIGEHIDRFAHDEILRQLNLVEAVVAEVVKREAAGEGGAS